MNAEKVAIIIILSSFVFESIITLIVIKNHDVKEKDKSSILKRYFFNFLFVMLIFYMVKYY